MITKENKENTSDRQETEVDRALNTLRLMQRQNFRLVKENAEQAKEIERLRKAGDILYPYVRLWLQGQDDWNGNAFDAQQMWEKARGVK